MNLSNQTVRDPNKIALVSDWMRLLDINGLLLMVCVWRMIPRADGSNFQVSGSGVYSVNDGQLVARQGPRFMVRHALPHDSLHGLLHDSEINFIFHV